MLSQTTDNYETAPLSGTVYLWSEGNMPDCTHPTSAGFDPVDFRPNMEVFTVGEDGFPMLTSLADKPAEHRTMNSRYVIRRDNGEWEMNLPLLFGDALKGGFMRHGDLMEWMKEHAGLNQIQYRANLIGRAVTERIIQKGQDQSGHVIYALPGRMPADLFSGAPR